MSSWTKPNGQTQPQGMRPTALPTAARKPATYRPNFFSAMERLKRRPPKKVCMAPIGQAPMAEGQE